MLRKQPFAVEIKPIVLPNTKIDIPTPASEPSPSRRRTQLQTANAMFDPNNASPANEFMQTLKLRMSVYYEQEINILQRMAD
jgi:hypothetical protein